MKKLDLDTIQTIGMTISSWIITIFTYVGILIYIVFNNEALLVFKLFSIVTMIFGLVSIFMIYKKLWLAIR